MIHFWHPEPNSTTSAFTITTLERVFFTKYEKIFLYKNALGYLFCCIFVVTQDCTQNWFPFPFKQFWGKFSRSVWAW
jgi:hypothetical protein